MLSARGDPWSCKASSIAMTHSISQEGAEGAAGTNVLHSGLHPSAGDPLVGFATSNVMPRLYCQASLCTVPPSVCGAESDASTPSTKRAALEVISGTVC